jgi:predicted alpha/beta-hydrolase family hydrolase
VEISTEAGAALVELDGAVRPPFLLVLTHGAGGGVASTDLLAARQAGLDLGGCVARVLQPYRVRGARAPGSADRQDAAWLEIVAALRGRYRSVPLIQGGRSNGARVACRTARAAGARAVLALAFPLHPPGHPDRSRDGELRDTGTDVLVINGSSDPFGAPEPGGSVQVVVLPGATHALARRDHEITDITLAWLAGLAGLPGAPAAGPGRVRRRAGGGA